MPDPVPAVLIGRLAVDRERHGFRSSPVEPKTLMVTIEEARRMMG